jgi:hypothetical protein
LPVDPGKHGLPSLLRNFELNGPAGLALHHYRTVKDASALRDIVDAQTDLSRRSDGLVLMYGKRALRRSKRFLIQVKAGTKISCYQVPYRRSAIEYCILASRHCNPPVKRIQGDITC